MFKKKNKTKSYRGTYALQKSYRKLDKKRAVRRRQNRQTVHLGKIFKRFITAAATFGIIYFLFFSQTFTLKQVFVENDNLDNKIVSLKIEKNLKQYLNKNLININTRAIERNLMKFFPEIKTITLEKDYPSTIIINFEKFPQAANLVVDENGTTKQYILNTIGFAVKEDFENPDLPFIKLESEEPINTDTYVISEEVLNYILSAKSEFETRFGMQITDLIYKKRAREVHLKTEKGFTIWLDQQLEIDGQYKKLKKALVKLDIYSQPLEYIDLRINSKNGERIIYKPL